MIRTISVTGLRFVLIFAVAMLFVSTTSVWEADAWFSSQAKCPCNFVSAFWLGKKHVKALGTNLIIDSCFADDEEAVANGSNGYPCFFEFETEFDDDSSGEFECSYKLECGQEIDECLDDDEVNSDFFLGIEVPDISEAEFEACRKEIKFIAEWLFWLECTDD